MLVADGIVLLRLTVTQTKLYMNINKTNQNNDGKVDAQDIEVWWKKSQAIMKDSVPEAGGFSAGFLLGARRGWDWEPSCYHFMPSNIKELNEIAASCAAYYFVAKSAVEAIFSEYDALSFFALFSRRCRKREQKSTRPSVPLLTKHKLCWKNRIDIII